MKSLFWVGLAVLCNAGAQVALKLGATTELRLQSLFSWPVLCGIGLYGIAFLLTLRIYADYPLSLISPLMAGAIFLVVNVTAVLLFAESFTLDKLGGMILIVLGIALLSRSA